MDPVIEATTRAKTTAPSAQALPALATGLQAACLSAVIDELDVGLLVCDAEARLVHANPAGRAELRWGTLLTLERESRVCAAVLAHRQSLLNAMAAALAGRRQLLLLKVPGETLSLAVLPLASTAGAAPRLMMMLGRRNVAPGLVVEMLCRMHAVTTAEQRVLHGLLRGRQAEDLAIEFGVKLSTVRSQISALRDKLGVARINDALRLAAQLPPMAGVLRHMAIGIDKAQDPPTH